MSVQLADLQSLISQTMSGVIAKQFETFEKNLDLKMDAKLLAIGANSNVSHSNDDLSDQINGQITASKDAMPTSEVFVPEENYENSNAVANQQVPLIEVVDTPLVADFPWLKADDSYDIKLGRNLFKKNMKRFSYLVGSGFDFRLFADKAGSVNQLNLNWLEGSGDDDLMNIAVDTKGDWDDFVNGIKKIFDCYSIELNKFYKDIDGQKMENSEVAEFCQDFVRAFPMVQTKYFEFKHHACVEKSFEVCDTTFYPSAIGWLANKLKRKLYYTQDDDGPKEKSPKSTYRTKNNLDKSLKRWLDTDTSPKTVDARKRFEKYLNDNPSVEHSYREEIKKRKTK